MGVLASPVPPRLWTAVSFSLFTAIITHAMKAMVTMSTKKKKIMIRM
eukprot:CAMPEP_0172801140 /NCGR_PEP_ID=MMETSP1075-20121228/2994_1 /TAXON_ID=2916 /ORGANISM="Ceratium fusus, Strain PA161109" /LENGTH=46 /DNA_ID= /DNA_START= /DNA_END= /DNA_ORIENTATION=